MNSIIIAGGRERLHFVLSNIPNLSEIVSAVIIMKEDDHEEVWSDKISALLSEFSIPWVIAKSFKNKEVRGMVSALPKSILLCENWRTMISVEDAVNFKQIIIFHESLLPKYRGFAPLTWPIINGEEKTGVTMFYAAEEVDAGNIIKQVTINIDDKDTSFDLFKKTYNVYLELISWLITAIKEGGQISGTSQDHSKATFGCMRTLEDSKIDWSASTKSIYNFIRALAPPFLLGAYTLYDEQIVYISKARINQSNSLYAGRIPGRITAINDGVVSVLTGDGIIDIDKVVVNGVELSASEVLNRMKIKLK